MDRRSFIKNLGLGAVAASMTTLTATSAKAAGTKKVLVVGGGFGGASVAKYLKMWGHSDVEVTLIDENAGHVSCILSNLVLNDQKTLANLTFDLTKSATKNQFNFKKGKVQSIDRNAKAIYLTGVTDPVYYDKLVLAPGIDFIYPTGINPELPDLTTPFPHAWRAGAQTTNLREQLRRLPSGGKAKVAMTIPKAPYRCPPGPYERACLIADYLKNKKSGGKLTVFDANSSIQAEPVNFGRAFSQIYSNIINYVPNRSVVKVSAMSQFDTNKSITVTSGITESTLTGFQMINAISPQKAPDFLKVAGLIAPGKLWAGVHVDTYQSLFDTDIYIIGDAHDSNQPKAGHIANSEAKICADALLRDLLSWSPRDPDNVPVTNSACYSPITSSTASFLTAGYRYDSVSDKMVRNDSSFGEAEQISSDNYKMMLAWANNLFMEVF